MHVPWSSVPRWLLGLFPVIAQYVTYRLGRGLVRLGLYLLRNEPDALDGIEGARALSIERAGDGPLSPVPPDQARSSDEVRAHSNLSTLTVAGFQADTEFLGWGVEELMARFDLSQDEANRLHRGVTEPTQHMVDEVKRVARTAGHATPSEDTAA